MRDTIDMAREAGFFEDTGDGQGMWMANTSCLKAFEALVRADEREQGQKWFDAVTAQHKQLILAEREACAKVCEDLSLSQNSEWEVGTLDCADAIRARGNI